MTDGRAPGSGARAAAWAPPPAPASAPALAPALVEFDEVTAAYRDRIVLRDLTFEIRAGERIALVGPNGAGKSSLLRALTGLLRLQSGSVRLDGRDVGDLDRLAIARRVSAVPQVANLPFAMPVEGVVALGRLPHEDPIRGPRPSDRAAVAAAIERVGLGGHLLGRDARELSLGERQLVLLALAVAQSAPLMLLDEPTVHLDLRHQVSAMELLVDLNERDGTTVLAVLHDLNLATHFFPRVMVLDHGRLVADGPPDVAVSEDRIREVFGVDPALLRIAGAAAAPATSEAR